MMTFLTLPPAEMPSDDYGWLIAVLVMMAVSAGTWWAFWHYMGQRLRRGLREQRGELEALKRDLSQWADRIGKLEDAGQTDAWLRPVEKLQREVQELRRFSDEMIETARPLERSVPVLTQRTFTPTPASSPAAPPTADAPPPMAPALVPPGREQLGAWFVQEVRRSEGMDPATIWEHYLARLKPILRDADYRQVHWDRVASERRFHDQPASHFGDTGKCWLMQAGGQALLFFPALAQSARKNDLPGCQIVSSGEAILYSSRLAEFTPPVVIQSSEGWTILTEGSAEYH